MYPELFTIGSVTIHTYGVMAALGFLSAILIVIFLSRRSGLPVEPMIDLAFWMVIIGFIGSRLLFVITRLDHFVQHPSEIFRVWEGGLVWYGGPLLAFPFGIWFVRRHQIDFWKAVDVAMPAMTAGHMFGRFGCFAAGCCYGKPTESFLGVVFKSDLIDPPFRGLALHPTQLYEGFALLILLLGMLRIYFRKQFDGQVFLVYLISYPIIRIIVEIFRGDAIRGYVIEGILSTSQLISLGVVALGIVIMRKRLRALAGFILCIVTLYGSASFAFPVTIMDQTGQTISVSKEPQRIVTLAPSLSEWVAELIPDQLDRLVGVSQWSDFPETLKTRTVIGAMNRINFEVIQSLKPDILFATRDGNIREQIVRLREMGLNVITVDSQSFEDIFRSVEIMGTVLGKRSLANLRIEQMKQAITHFKKRAEARVGAGDRKRILIELNRSPLLVVGGRNFINEAIEILGFQNIFRESEQRFPRASLEEVAKKKPEVTIRLSDYEVLSRPTFRIVEGMSRVENAHAKN